MAATDLNASAAARSPFDPSPEREAAAVRGGVLTVAGQAVRTAVQIGGMVFLARVLTPRDFGLVAMVAVVTGFVALFTSMGLSAATVQRADICQDRVSGLFWANAGLGVLFAALTAAASPALAWVFDEPRLTAITAVTACGFVLGGLTAQHTAVLRRRMRFVPLAGIAVAAQAAGVAAGVGLAVAGAGVWALVSMPLTSAATSLGLSWVLSGWRPTGVRAGVRAAAAAGDYSYGGKCAAYDVCVQVSNTVDNAWVGWFWGAGPLGLYSRSYGLLMLPITQIRRPLGSVAMPALSRAQGDPALLRRRFAELAKTYAVLAMPLCAVAAVLPGELVLTLLGPDWVEATELFRIFAAGGVFQVFWSVVPWLYLPVGAAGRLSVLAGGHAALAALGCGLVLPWGPGAVALVQVCGTVAVLPLAFLWLPEQSAVRLTDVAKMLTPELALAGVVAAVAVAVRASLPRSLPAVAVVAAVGAVTAAVWGGWLVATGHPLFEQSGVKSVLARFGRSPRVPAGAVR